jgi:hypothetical protein
VGEDISPGAAASTLDPAGGLQPANTRSAAHITDVTWPRNANAAAALAAPKTLAVIRKLLSKLHPQQDASAASIIRRAG